MEAINVPYVDQYYLIFMFEEKIHTTGINTRSSPPLLNLHFHIPFSLFILNEFSDRQWESDQKKYEAPYFAVCQSSRYGKSRLVTDIVFFYFNISC